MLQRSITVMARSSPHQISPHQVESTNVHQPDEFLNLKHQKDLENYQEGSLHTVHTSGSGFRRKGGCIYVEKTSEQCNLNHYRSQRAREDA